MLQSAIGYKILIDWRCDAASIFHDPRRRMRSARVLVLRAEPPDGIAIERLRMKVADLEFVGDTDTLKCKQPWGQVITFTQCLGKNAHIGLSL
jgi:hypothetical protein